MKILKWISDNILLVISLFFFAFIPLYPKLPLIGVSHTFVYIRAEDFLVAVSVLVYLYLLWKKRTSADTPLTVPIFAYWLVGLLSTIIGVIFIFPHLANVFPKNAFLFYFRHIEYMSLFFIAYGAMKERKYFPQVVGVILVTILLVVLYGIGQRFVPQFFPAFSTMNEEFAKGIPLTLSAAGRIQSTFAGHYDLAAFLVMMIPLIGSLIFGVRKWWMKISLLLLAGMSLLVLLMTASRTSFAMYLMAVIFMLILQKQKKWIIPVIIVSLLLLRSFSGIYSRYVATVSQVNVVVDARTGKAIGVAQQSDSGTLVIKDVQSTGENLPHGSQYNVSTENVATGSSVTIERQKGGAKSIDITNLQGNFVVKKAQALDVSITTRFQAEWPNAINAFKRNILFGSGYSAITLATDGNYFRILGETGLLGFLTFAAIFFVFAVYVYYLLPSVKSDLARSFVLGVCAALVGLGLNAVLIDVFEASKVAFVLWLMLGFAVGILHQYEKKQIHLLEKIRDVFTSLPSILFSLLILAFLFFSQMLNNFFVADDFTWLRWMGDCKKVMNGATDCQSMLATFSDFFLNSENFFYRPGAKLYFYVMYKYAWLNPAVYHLVSLLLHVAITALLFLISERILKSRLFAFLAALLFLVISAHSETVFWISSVGHLFATLFALIGLWMFMLWRDRNNSLFLILSLVSVFLSPLFHEYGVFAVLLIGAFALLTERKQIFSGKLSALWQYSLYLIPVVLYFVLKIVSHSLWAAGDYRYNLLKLPFNALGNAVGYIGMTLVGNPFLSWYDYLRTIGRENFLIPLIGGVVIVLGAVLVYRLFSQKCTEEEKNVLYASLIFFFVPLLPFLGLRNIAPRYMYLASFGLILFIVFLMQKWITSWKGNLRYLSLGISLFLVTLFSAYHAQQLALANTDWESAGNITNNVLLFMNNIYEEEYTVNNPTFYFANVPIHLGQAWVFPVGLEDAIWFDYRDKKVSVVTVPSVQEALVAAKTQKDARIFQFDQKGNFSEVPVLP